MELNPLTRDDLLTHIVRSGGASLTHLEGPSRGKPLGMRRVNALVTHFIREQKAGGLLVERRPYTEATTRRRRVRFLFIPQTMDLFLDMPGADQNAA